MFAVDADTFLATDREYDVVCASSVMHHLPDYKATLARCARPVRPGGVIYITHEPLPKAERAQPAPIQDALTWLGWKVWGAWWRRLKHTRLPMLNYTLSDVHVEEGISPEGMLDMLRAFSMEPMFIRRYRAEPLAIVAWLNNEWFRSRPQLFTLMARKTVQ